MAEEEKKPKINLDVNAPVTAEELREHEVVDHLLKTHPELQEKSEVSTALDNGIKKFHFGWKDLASTVGFGLIFGVTFGYLGTFAVEPLANAGFATASHFIEGLCGTFGFTLGVKSAIAHPISEITKTFYDKCKDGYTAAKEHNQAVHFLKERVNVIKRFKERNIMRSIMENPNGVIQGFQPQTQTESALPEYDHQRARVVDTILAEKKKNVPEMSWVQRTEAQTSTPNQPSL